MDGHEYIKIYDNVVPKGLTTDIKAVSQPNMVTPVHEFHDIDVPLFECISKVVLEYKSEFGYMTSNHTIDLNDDGYYSGQADVLFPKDIQCEAKTREETARVATIIVFCDNRSEIEFPYHGIKIGASEGRAIAFPAHWTHPFRVHGTGVLLKTNLIYT